MHVSVRDYGTALQASWYLSYHRGFFEKLIPDPLVKLDLFDEQDLRAYADDRPPRLPGRRHRTDVSVGKDASTLERALERLPRASPIAWYQRTGRRMRRHGPQRWTWRDDAPAQDQTALGWHWSDAQQEWQLARIAEADRSVHLYIIGASGQRQDQVPGVPDPSGYRRRSGLWGDRSPRRPDRGPQGLRRAGRPGTR